ncbi:MAG: hypothetical protein RL701_5018 [Pseudomonadota bacterium]
MSHSARTHGVRGLLIVTLAFASLWVGVGLGSRVSAQEQFVLLDETFTATTQSTMKSMHTLMPLPAAPANWKSPVDYTKGSVNVRIEILDKPTTRKTLCNVCFEVGTTLTCMPYPPPYSDPGVYSTTPNIKDFWQFSVYDWTKKIDRLYMVLKDENGVEVQGDSQFYPSKMRITMTVLPEGQTFSEGGPKPAGAGGSAGARPSGSGGAGGSKPASTGSGGTGAPGGSQSAGSKAPSGAAGASPAGRAGAAAAPVTPSATPVAGKPAAVTAGSGGAGGAQERTIRDYIDPGSSCRVSRPGGAASGAGWLAALGVLSLATVRLRRKRRWLDRCSTPHSPSSPNA